MPLGGRFETARLALSLRFRHRVAPGRTKLPVSCRTYRPHRASTAGFYSATAGFGNGVCSGVDSALCDTGGDQIALEIEASAGRRRACRVDSGSPRTAACCPGPIARRTNGDAFDVTSKHPANPAGGAASEGSSFSETDRWRESRPTYSPAE